MADEMTFMYFLICHNYLDVTGEMKRMVGSNYRQLIFDNVTDAKSVLRVHHIVIKLFVCFCLRSELQYLHDLAV